MTTELTFEKFCQEYLKEQEHAPLFLPKILASQFVLSVLHNMTTELTFAELCQEHPGGVGARLFLPKILKSQFVFKCTEIMTIELTFADYARNIQQV